MQRLTGVDLVCPVGECHTYQNLTFSALGDVIEQAVEQSYEQALQNYIFDPLEMNTASVGNEALQASVAGQCRIE